jgi:hypothetical protein
MLRAAESATVVPTKREQAFRRNLIRGRIVSGKGDSLKLVCGLFSIDGG